MRKVAGEHPFCLLIYMNSYIYHICFILFNLLSYLIFDLVCLTLSSADAHGIAKYASTNIRNAHTHAHTPKKKVERLRRKKVKKNRKKRGGVRKERVRETGDWYIFLGPPERTRAETGGADQWVLKQREC